MEIFRICLSKYAARLSASGKANRWNEDGQFVMYASQSRSLATLEWAVKKTMVNEKASWSVMILSIPDDEDYFTHVQQKSLPSGWRFPSAIGRLRERGSEWYSNHTSLILKVPSAVIPQEHNYIINTVHPDFKKKVKLVRKESYFWDERLS